MAASERLQARSAATSVGEATQDVGLVLASAPVFAQTAAAGDDDRGRLILVVLLLIALGAIAVAVAPRVAGPFAALERYRIEFAGLSAACLVVALLSAGGII